MIWCDRDQAWWCHDATGYTSNVLHAGVYTEDDAERLSHDRDFDIPRRLLDVLGLHPPPDGSSGYLLGVHRLVVLPDSDHYPGTVVRRGLLAEADGMLGHALHRNRDVFVDDEAVEGVIRELRWEYERGGKQ